mgnify:CR=1 FL=1
MEEAGVALGTSFGSVCAPATEFQQVHEVHRVHRVACAQTPSRQHGQATEVSSRAFSLDSAAAGAISDASAAGAISDAMALSGAISLNANQESGYGDMVNRN